MQCLLSNHCRSYTEAESKKKKLKKSIPKEIKQHTSK